MVIPVSGNNPIMAETFMIVWKENQPQTPAAKIRLAGFFIYDETRKILTISARKTPRITTNPIKPNVSPRIAKTESLMASGR